MEIVANIMQALPAPARYAMQEPKSPVIAEMLLMASLGHHFRARVYRSTPRAA
jgi:hypothetical protein